MIYNVSTQSRAFYFEIDESVRKNKYPDTIIKCSSVLNKKLALLAGKMVECVGQVVLLQEDGGISAGKQSIMHRNHFRNDSQVGSVSRRDRGPISTYCRSNASI